MALVWLLLPSAAGEDKRAMIIVALVATVFAATLLGTSARIGARWLTPVSLISTVVLSCYTLYGGATATVFALLYVVAAGPTAWFLSGFWTIVQIGWMVYIYALALWFSGAPGEPAWPQPSSRDLAIVLVTTGALSAAALLIRAFKRRIVEGDERVAAIVESSQDAIMSADRDGVITVWNPGAERLYGYAASEAIGQPVRLLIRSARRVEERTVLGRALAGEHVEHYQTERVCKDGSVVIVSLSLSPIRDLDGRVIGASCIARDVTSAIHAQEQIALQAELLDEVDAAVIFLDAAGVARYWSRGAQRLYGYTAEEAIGHGLGDLIMPEESRVEMLRLRSSVQAGQPVEGEFDVHDKQGRVLPVYFRARPVSLGGEGGAGAGDISVAVDISVSREAEQAVRRYAEGQREIANLGRLALKGASLEELFDHAVGAVSRALSADCAELIQHLPDAPDLIVSATIGWADNLRRAHIPGDGRSAPGYMVRSREPLVVEDWEQERRFAPSSKLLARGVRSSVGVLVGDPDSAFGVLAAHYTRPG